MTVVELGISFHMLQPAVTGHYQTDVSLMIIWQWPRHILDLNAQFRPSTVTGSYSPQLVMICGTLIAVDTVVIPKCSLCNPNHKKPQ